ncbi:maleylpyruvate isomerase N-terminal domain-containing protein [Streptomyces sp. NPDC058439]|uniref:maleylpyruvate isomerase N-terminal domain-containing protein n=1 Tax=Streptomyces sp. NPDC058439 TaxID=3346500 RepID=UPI003662DC89
MDTRKQNSRVRHRTPLTLLSDEFLARIAAIPTTRWDASSPCAGWTARDVVAHVVNGHRCILVVVNGKPPTAADGVGISSACGSRQTEAAHRAVRSLSAAGRGWPARLGTGSSGVEA